MRILLESRTESGLESLEILYRPPEDLAACVNNCLDWAAMQRTRPDDPWVWSRVTVDEQEDSDASD